MQGSNYHNSASLKAYEDLDVGPEISTKLNNELTPIKPKQNDAAVYKNSSSCFQSVVKCTTATVHSIGTFTLDALKLTAGWTCAAACNAAMFSVPGLISAVLYGYASFKWNDCGYAPTECALESTRIQNAVLTGLEIGAGVGAFLTIGGLFVMPKHPMRTVVLTAKTIGFCCLATCDED